MNRNDYNPSRNRLQPEKINFDFFIDGKLNVKWLDEKAKDFSENKICSRHNEVKYNQVRAFYDEFITFKMMPFDGDEFQEKVVPLLKLLKAKIVNRQNRRVLDRDEHFKNFIINLVDSVKNRDTLEKACLIFEAVAGYFPKLKG